MSVVTSNVANHVLYIIDGSSLLYRGYYGVKPLHAPDGTPVQAVYVFCRMIYALIEKFSPMRVIIAWDSPGKTVRHVMYPSYKATRQAPPTDIFVQKELIQEFCRLIGIEQIAQSGIEADDIIYSLALDWIAADEEHQVVLVTSDKDMGQMVNERIVWYDPAKDIWYDVATLTKKLGFSIAKLPFYFSLVGDVSDNIPGVKGVGEKTALNLVITYNSLDDLYARIDTVKQGRVANALSAYKDAAYLSYQLFLLQYITLSYSFQLSSCQLQDWSRANIFFDRLGFLSLKKKVKNTYQAYNAIAPIIEQLKQYNFILVTTIRQLDDLCERIRLARIFSFDTETDGVMIRSAQLIGVSIAIDNSGAWYIPCGHKGPEEQLSWAIICDALKIFFMDDTIIKIAHNAKFDQLILKNHGIDIVGIVFDTMIAASLVITNPVQKIGLKDLAYYYNSEVMLTYDQVVVQQGYDNFAQVPLGIALYYAANDALQTWRLYLIFKKQLLINNQEELVNTIEFPLVPVLVAMEYQGIGIDVNLLLLFSKQVEECLLRLEDEIKVLIATLIPTPLEQKFNLNSSKQMEHLLFTHLQLTPIKKSKKTERYSTDYEVLVELAKIHPVPQLILKYRELSKLKSTYLDALPLYVQQKTGRIHTHFSQTRVATGRLASSDPNMQNIPSESQMGISVRAAFIPQAGYVFISVDYSQIELRVLAHISNDLNLIDAFLEGRDIHTQTAAIIFSIPEEHVTNEQRQIGKKINFSIIYGLTPYGLSKDLGISVSQARAFIDAYFARYQGIRVWMEKVIAFVHEHGYTQTVWGRRRYLPGIYERNKNLYEEACRAAINTVVQGTQAELVKKAMIAVYDMLQKIYPMAHILLQIHDELVIEAPCEQSQGIANEVAAILSSIVSWSVPLEVKIRIGCTWQDISK